MNAKPPVESNLKVFEFRGSKERESKKRKVNSSDDLKIQQPKHQSRNLISKYFSSVISTRFSTLTNQTGEEWAKKQTNFKHSFLRM